MTLSNVFTIKDFLPEARKSEKLHSSWIVLEVRAGGVNSALSPCDSG